MSSLGAGPLVYGAGTTSSTTASRSLQSDEFYVNFTVPAGVTLQTNGYRLFVNGTLTLAGIIANGGGTASGTTAGTGAPSGTVGGGSAGGSGSGGGALQQALGGAGGAGGNGAVIPASPGGVLTVPTPAEGGPTLYSNALAVLQGRTTLSTLINGGTGRGSGWRTSGLHGVSRIFCHLAKAAAIAYQSMLHGALALTRWKYPTASDEPEKIVENFKKYFYDTELFFDPFVRGKFAQDFFKAHEEAGKPRTVETAHQLIEEAQLFIEACHGCHARMSSAPVVETA